MKNMRTISFLLGCFLLMALAFAAELTWTKFTSDKGRLTVLFPGKPVESKETLKTPIGEIDMNMLTVSPDPNIAYIVSYSDYPKAHIESNTPKAFLEAARDGAVGAVRGKLEEQQDMKMGTYPGKEILVRIEGGVGIRQRMYLVGTRLYQMVYVDKYDNLKKADPLKFLDSLTVSPPPQ